MSLDGLALALVTLPAAVVNGALGHGFSSITVPLALLFYSSRVLNPALVLVEAVINAYVLLVNRGHVRAVSRRVLPIVVGLVPGVVAGTWILSSVSPTQLRLAVFTVLLPLILVQAAGIRRPVRAERVVGAPVGAGIGVLYSVTTISGPPLALLFNNQGLAKGEFRAALGLIRLAESTLTATAYAVIGLYTPASGALVPWLAPSVVIGIPLGAALVRRLDAETFRRVCMSFDAWVVGFGLSRAVMELVPGLGAEAYAILIAAAVTDTMLLARFFDRRRVMRGATVTAGAGAPITAGAGSALGAAG